MRMKRIQHKDGSLSYSTEEIRIIKDKEMLFDQKTDYIDVSENEKLPFTSSNLDKTTK